MRRGISKGFSLVELLVVIAIFGVLIAIILPAVNRAREMGKRTVCLSNIRQLTTAWTMYANDNRVHFCCAAPTPPSWFDGVVPEYFAWGWLGAYPNADTVTSGKLWPYLRNRTVYVCPDDPQTLRGTGSGWPEPGQTGVSYNVNAMLGAAAVVNGRMIDPTPGGASQPLPVIYTLGAINHPDRMFVFIEASDDLTGTSGVVSTSGAPYAAPIYPRGLGSSTNGSTLRQPGQLHMSALKIPAGCTISFLDGHAIFWQYASPSIIREWQVGNRPDFWQLAAWGGGAVPPGVVP